MRGEVTQTKNEWQTAYNTCTITSFKQINQFKVELIGNNSDKQNDGEMDWQTNKVFSTHLLQLTILHLKKGSKQFLNFQEIC